MAFFSMFIDTPRITITHIDSFDVPITLTIIHILMSMSSNDKKKVSVEFKCVCEFSNLKLCSLFI